jgi:hypothetical protein
MPKRSQHSINRIEDKFDRTAFRLTQERNDFLMPQILDFVNSKRWVNLRPEYQRRLVWSVQKQSLFIESLLLNIPIPQIFLFETDLSRYEVMDGQQRLNAVVSFYENGFALRGLEKWQELNGLRYRELPDKLQRGLDRRRLSATVLLLESAKDSLKEAGDVRKLVFERLNTGGQQLNAQELRNCLYAGAFNDMLIEVARAPEFSELWGIPAYAENVDAAGAISSKLATNRIYSRMLDCEIVLRFFAFRDPNNLSGSVRDMLDRCMESNVKTPPAQVQTLGEEFLARLAVARSLFGEHAFKYRDKKGHWKPSQPLFDGLMVAIDQLWSKRAQLTRRSKHVQKAVESLLAREGAFDVIVGRPNTAKAVAARVTMLRNAIVKATR